MMIRKEMAPIVKKALREYMLEERTRLELTQEEMSASLAMSPRSYADIERGVSCCGTLTTLMLLMSMEEPETFLEELRERVERCVDEDTMYV